MKCVRISSVAVSRRHCSANWSADSLPTMVTSMAHLSGGLHMRKSPFAPTVRLYVASPSTGLPVHSFDALEVVFLAFLPGHFQNTVGQLIDRGAPLLFFAFDFDFQGSLVNDFVRALLGRFL